MKSNNNVSHITLLVKNINKSLELFKDILGATEHFRSSEREYSLYPEVYLNLFGVWLVLMEKEEESLYFYDFDNHLIELHTGDIDDRLTHNISERKRSLHS